MTQTRFIFISIAVSIGLLGSGVSVCAQQSSEDRMAELRKQIEELEAQADQFRDAISRQQGTAKTLQTEIKNIDTQIKRIETEIFLTNKKIDKTELEIDGTQGVISDTEHRIERKKETIGELLLAIQHRDNQTLLASLLKYSQLSELFRQAEYASTINTSLISLIQDLKNEKNSLEEEKANLEEQKSNLEDLNRQSQHKQSSLGEVKTGKNTLLKETKGQEAAYQKMLKEVEQKKSLFFTELRELETHVIQGGLYLVHITAPSVPPRGTKLFQWPEDEYTITQGYGYTSFSRRGAYGGAAHNGIDISSGFGTQIKAIGDGEIVANGFNSGWGNWVAIKHDNSLVSVYGHMSSLSFLRVGTRVKVGEVIGYEGSTGNSTGSHLHLSLYKEFFTYVNEKNGQLYFNYFDGSLNPMHYLP